jgi:hypothetical protein
MSRPDLPFEILWLGYDRKIVGIQTILRYDLTEAIRSAALMMREGAHPPKEAHGFFVRRKEDSQ